MGYRDRMLRLNSPQTITADANSTDYIDTELTAPEWEKGGPIGVVINVEAACNDSTGLQFIVVHKTSEPTVNDANLVTVRVLTADLAKGDEIIIWLPTGVPLLRYIRLYYDEITGDNSTFACSAYLTMGLPMGGQK